jgi:hypothetical protein
MPLSETPLQRAADMHRRAASYRVMSYSVTSDRDRKTLAAVADDLDREACRLEAEARRDDKPGTDAVPGH